MKVLVVYTRMYAACLRRALESIAKNPWTLLLPMLLVLVSTFGFGLLARMGPVGGILAGFFLAALFSCYLYFLGELVANSRVRLSELKRSVGAYFWAVVNVMFVFWVARLLIRLVGGANAPLLTEALVLVAYVALNALPETLYLRGTYGGLATIQESFHFLQEHWVEWLLPNLLLGAAGYLLLTAAPLLPAPALTLPLLLGAFVHVAAVFRGHLFRELAGSSHRQRMFRYGETQR